MFAVHLDHVFGVVEYVNHADSGYMIADLAEQLGMYALPPFNQPGDPMVIQDVMAADLISINIGGNELLQPLLGLIEDFAVAEGPLEKLAIFEEIIGEPYYDDLMELLLADVPAFIQLYSAITAAESIDEAILLMKQTLGMEAVTLIKAAIADRAATMGTDATIAVSGLLAYIRGINPDAVIYINNLYNPIEFNESLHKMIDPVILSLNASIEAAVMAANDLGPEGVEFCYVVDVYEAFESYKNPVKNLVHGVPSEALVDISALLSYIEGIGKLILASADLPPLLHQTDRGYTVIFQEHKKRLTVPELTELILIELPVALP